MSGYVYLNGQYLLEEEARIPVSDRGFLFGDGVFTTLRVCDGVVEFAEHHLNRLSAQCDTLAISRPSLQLDQLHELVEKNRAYDGVWRMKIIVTGGCGTALNVSSRSIGALLVTVKRYQPHSRIPCKLVIYPHPISKPTAAIKSLSYLDRLIVKQYALDHHADDAIVTSLEGFLLESAFSNIFWCCDNTLIRPPKCSNLYSGVAIEVLEEIAKEIGWGISEERVASIPAGAKPFLCNAMTGPIPVDQIGDNFYARDKKVEDVLIEAYRQRALEAV